MTPTTRICVAIAVLALAMASFAHAGSETTVVFGINLALDSPPSQSFAGTQLQVLYGLEIWRDWWNALPASNRTTNWGDSIKVQLHVERFSNYSDDGLGINQHLLYETYANMSQNSSINYFFAPVASPWDIQLRNYSYYALGIPFMVAASDSSEEYYATPGSYGAPTSNVLTMTSYLPYLRVAKAQTVAVIQVQETYQRELCQGVSDQAAINGLEVVTHEYMPFDYNSFGWVSGIPDREAAWTAALQDAKANDADAVFICDYGFGAEWALNWMRTNNWMPKSVTVSTLYLSFQDPTLLDYVTTMDSYNAQARFPNQTMFTDSQGYNDLVQATFGVPAATEIARGTLSGMIWSNAIISASANTTDAMAVALATEQFSSFMGISAFDASHRQTLSSLVLQLLQSGNVSNVIGPAQAAAEALIYPMPTWDERIFKPKWGTGVEIAGAILMIVGGLITFGWVIFLIVHWNHRVVIAASPLFCLTILVGSLLVFISIFSWMPNLITDSVCNLRAWLLPLGFMTMFGSLLAKTDRINRLYNAKGMNIIVISNTQVALIILIICVIQAILSVLMVTVPQLQAHIDEIDPYRVSKNFWVCTFPTSLKILFGINVGYAFLLLIWGTYLAYRIRNVPISIYDESKVIAFSIYNTAFFGVIVIVIQLAIGNTNRNLTFMITAVCCFLGATITTCTLFAAKWFAIYRPASYSKSSGLTVTSSSDNSGSKGVSGGSSSTSANAEELKKCKRRNKALKEHIKEMKERIRQLETLAQEHGFLQDEDEDNDVEMGKNGNKDASEESD